MFCSKCGAEAPADANFCAQCGVSLKDSVEQTRGQVLRKRGVKS